MVLIDSSLSVCHTGCCMHISRVSDQSGVSLVYIKLEIHHSGREPSIRADQLACVHCQEGQMLRQLLAGSGKSLSLELSGRSAMVVFDNADLDSVVEGVVEAAWGYQGQVRGINSLLHVDIFSVGPHYCEN